VESVVVVEYYAKIDLGDLDDKQLFH